MPYRKHHEVVQGVRRFLMTVVWLGMLGWSCMGQEQAPPAPAAKGTTLIGCLAGPDADNHYTLTSMQHRLGVDVVGDESLSKAAGTKVKLTGTWATLPGSEGKKGDATRQFKVTEVAVMEEKCPTPAPVTPVSKNKQAQKK
jgi:hypothetical protein